jgi:DNA-directed RNA polymerase subunit RPC12/RpoP
LLNFKEDFKMAKRMYVCETCGALAEEPGHLCNPKGQQKTACPYCGDVTPHKSHFCEGKMKDLSYVCEKCGRLATSADSLCEPQKVPTS